MKKNIGTIDRAIRVLIAVVLAILVFAKVINGVAGIVLLILASVFVITSLLGFCPLYFPFGLKTNKKQG